MKASIYTGPQNIQTGERPDPAIVNPSDVIVRVVLSCVCGSDLWYYRGISPHAIGSIGHEFIGVIQETGSDVHGLKSGDFVIAPFTFNDGTCANCLAGWTGNCMNGGSFGNGTTDGGQGQYVCVPFADTTLVKVPGSNHSPEIMKSLLALSDVMCTGYHAAKSAGINEGDTVAVVGDGAVGLCAIISAKLLGATKIIALSKNPDRQKIALEFGATDIVAERGDEAIKKLLEMTEGVGVDAALECVGTNESMNTAISISRVGSVVGAVGVPHGIEMPINTMIFKNIGLKGGIAPARRYIPELLDDVLSGKINPGLVFNFETNIEGIEEAYKAMDERRAVKSLIKVSNISL